MSRGDNQLLEAQLYIESLRQEIFRHALEWMEKELWAHYEETLAFAAMPSVRLLRIQWDRVFRLWVSSQVRGAMIVTDWQAAREAIVEQRGERLVADIEALLRERELIRPGTDGCYDAEARIKELEARLAEFEEHERQTHNRLGSILGFDDSLEAGALRLLARIKELEAQLDAIKKIKVSREDVWGIRRARKATEGKP